MATSAANPLASGVTAELYRAAIGPRGQDYYLRQFMRFDADGKAGTSWHWPAYCCTLNWLVYRRMWGWALAYVAAVLGLVLLIFGVGKLVFDYSDTSALLLFLGLLTAAFVVPALYANAWFYRHCTGQITAALRGTGEVKDACEVLARQAPDNRRLLGLVLANVAVLALAVGVLNWFQSADSSQPMLAARDERPLAGGQSGQVRPLASPPVARVASAPAAVASAPALVASAAAAAASPVVVATAASAPRVAQAASAATTTAVAPPAKPVTPAKSPIVNAADRAPRAIAPASAPVAVATPAATAEPTPAAAARPAAPAKAPRVRYVWVIQVGAYAQPANAQNALAQVQALGLEAGAESFETAKGPLTRVRVGPYTRQAEAEQAALRIKTLNLPVLVIRQRP